MKDLLALRARCLPGLEGICAGELHGLGVAAPEPGPGCVRLEARATDLPRLLLGLGTATGLAVELGRFRATDFGELLHKVRRLPWPTILPDGAAFAVRARSRRSRLYHSGAIEERLRRGVEERIGAGPGGIDDSGLPRVEARFDEDMCDVLVELAGEPLHRRGYRLEPGAAPLREDLARALLLCSGWTPDRALLDPFCGAGTILCEAAWLARDRAPGLGRGFAIDRTRLFDAEAWERERDAAEARVRDAAPAPILGADRAPEALAAARTNAGRAGVEADVELVEAPLSRCPWLSGTEPAPPRGTLVTHPPFGQRLKGRALAHLYQSLGTGLARLGEAWGLAMVVHDARLARRVGVPLRQAFRCEAGGLPVRAMVHVGDRPLTPEAGDG